MGGDGLMARKLSKKAARVVVDRLGWTSDDLHRTARDWQGAADSPDRAAYREAADYLSDLRKKVKS